MSYLSVGEVAQELSTEAHKVTTRCVYSWIQKGVKGPGGERVKLRAIQTPARKLVPHDELEKFLAKLSGETVRRARVPRRQVLRRPSREEIGTYPGAKTKSGLASAAPGARGPGAG